MSGKNFDDVIKRKLAKLEEIRQERKQLEVLKSARDAEKAKEKYIKKIKSFVDFDKICEETLRLTPQIENPTVSSSKKKENENIQILKDNVETPKRDISEKLSKLTVFHTEITDIQPRDILTSTKSTQTKNSNACLQRLVIKNIEDSHDDDILEGGFKSKLPPGCMSPGLPKVEFVLPAITRLESIIEERKAVTELTEEEKLAFISNTNFQNALKRIGSVVENVVANNRDITKDYTRPNTSIDDADDVSCSGVLLNVMFECELTTNRCITDMDWSPFVADRIVASYHSNVNEPLAPEGMTLVWNASFGKTYPEYIMHSSSAVMSICFDNFDPNIIIGGTYSGQIVMWDTRSPKSIPIQTTKLNSGAHVQPIRSLNINSHNIYSISSDGRFCTWNMDMLSKPIDVFTLGTKQKRPIAATCMTFTDIEYNDFLVGGEDGCVYKANRFDANAGIKAKYEQHDCPISGISMSHSSASEFNHLFLTSSIDSTIKLWSLHSENPLHTIYNNFDYVMDISWCPTNPALFGTVNESGHIDLWNINMDSEEPIVSTIVDGQPALNRFSWMPNAKHIAVGDLDGRLYLYEADNRLTQPVHNENSALIETLDMLRQKSLIRD
ncbi:cytoplasmic dynein 1 intermediate chain-like isoform X1 [Musca domestica]|uniref:Cytoplasmic dynein 1 intermediate chain-like isoform X1 n=1 Tax=Musca domestica TaxID=7370 RepID=A0ABM3UNC7_MUSDO|nr:cytoplasmic dynein 1 intermediate chain-like isoform X1 [Musca domestica]